MAISFKMKNLLNLESKKVLNQIIYTTKKMMRFKSSHQKVSMNLKQQMELYLDRSKLIKNLSQLTISNTKSVWSTNIR